MSKHEKVHPSSADEALIFDTVEAAKNFHGLSDANLYFSGKTDFVPLGNNVYRYKDYFVNVGKRLFLAIHSRAIMALSNLELSCIAQGIAEIWFDNDEDMLLITRIRGSEAHSIVPFEADVSALPLGSRLAVFRDVERLLENDYAISEISESMPGWYILEDEYRIILSHCQLAYAPDNAKAAYRKRILNLLNLEV